MQRMKRGISTFPFLLIFSLIAGAVILTFFFGFGQDLLGLLGRYNSLSLAKNIDQQLAAFTFASHAHNVIPFGKKADVSVSCSNGESIISVDDQSLPTQKLILAPTVLRGNSLRAWTLSWDYPFKVENFYFLFDDDVSYFFQDTLQGKETYFKTTFKAIKNDISLLSSTLPHIKKIIVLFRDSNVNYFNYPHVLRVVKIDFRDKKILISTPSENKEFTLLGDPLAYAALFTQSIKDYECVQKEAIERLNTLTELHVLKTLMLRDLTEDSCLYDITYLDELKSQEQYPPLTYPDAAQNLEVYNKNLELANCPGIYLQ